MDANDEKLVQNITSRLRFISKIRAGDKIDVQSLTLMREGIVTSAYRTFFTRAESRESALSFFQTTIDDAFRLLSRCLNANDQFHRDIGSLIISFLRECITGINNHKKTYSSDKMYQAKVEAFLEIFEAKLNDLNRKNSRKVVAT